MGSYALLRLCLDGLGLLLLPAPVFLLVGTAAGIGWKLLLPQSLALLLGLGLRRLPKKLRFPAVLLSMALCAAAALWLLRAGQGMTTWAWTGAVLMALAAAIYPRQLAVMSGEGAFSGLWYTGLALNGAAWLLSALLELPDTAPLLGAHALLYGVYLAFALSFGSLREGVGQGRAPSRGMILKNMLAALVWALLFLLLTHLPQVAQAIRAALDALRRAIVWLIEWISRLRSAPVSGMGGGQPDLGALVGEAAEPSWFVQALETVLRVAAAVLLLAAGFLLLRQLFRALRRGLKSLMAKLKAYMDTVSESYEDQVESLLDWGEVKRGLRVRRERRRLEREERIPWERLSPREQVRRSYRLYLQRHPEIPAQKTARQTLPGRQADIYEAARYSSREITPEEAREARDGCR